MCHASKNILCKPEVRPIDPRMTVIVALPCPKGHVQEYEFAANDLQARLSRGTLTFQCATCRVSWTATVEDQVTVRRGVAISYGLDPRD